MRDRLDSFIQQKFVECQLYLGTGQDNGNPAVSKRDIISVHMGMMRNNPNLSVIIRAMDYLPFSKYLGTMDLYCFVSS